MTKFLRFGFYIMVVAAITACEQQPSKPITPEAVSIRYRDATWSELIDWPGSQLETSWAAWLKSCSQLRTRDMWRALCESASKIPSNDQNAQQQFFERNFVPWRIENNAGSDSAFITGYYHALLTGGRNFKPGRVPIYGVPSDMLTIDLGELFPELKNKRVRGRLQGQRVVPYWNRHDIDNGKLNSNTKVLAWADDPLDAFFLQVQGSGRIQLDDGSLLHLGYADQNGHPYRSIGKWLVDQGELTLAQSSMQSIRAWAIAHPKRVAELLESNPSYVFFKIVPATAGATGALNVSLTNAASVAIDPQFIPLGAPLYMSTMRPDNNAAINQLVHAQDTGGAIRGPLRVDLFWGDNAEAADLAGIMKQNGKLWLLWPKGLTPSAPQ